MQDLITIPMVDVISEITGKEIAMKNTGYVYLDTKEDVSAEILVEAKAQKQEKEEKLNFEKGKEVGEVYTHNKKDYRIPFMKDDADGVIQVTIGFMNDAFSETVISFTNGVKLPIAKEDFNEFALWFAGKRNTFFKE